MSEIFYKSAKKLLVAVDCIIFGFENERLKLLLFKRKIEPFKDEWSLIGSFIKPTESIEIATNRVLKMSTGLKGVYMELVGNYGQINRDPGDRVISMAHYALIRINNETQQKQLEEIYQASWFEVENIPNLILDHNKMVEDALLKLKQKARYQPIGFELLPEKFTIPQLKNLYDAIYQKSFDRRNFRKKILSMDILEKLDEKDKSTSKKGAFLYRFDKNKYQNLSERGFNFEL